MGLLMIAISIDRGGVDLRGRVTRLRGAFQHQKLFGSLREFISGVTKGVALGTDGDAAGCGRTKVESFEHKCSWCGSRRPVVTWSAPRALDRVSQWSDLFKHAVGRIVGW